MINTQFPLIQAPMAGIQTHELCVAVSEAGGLGSLPCAMLSPEAMRTELHMIRQKTSKPYNVNFFCHAVPRPAVEDEQRWRNALAPYFSEFGINPEDIPTGAGRVPFSEQAAEVLEEFRPPVVSFHFGLPDQKLLNRVKAWGAKVFSSATTVEEAVWLEKNGADAVIAQGLEAGGHRGMFLTNDITTQLGTIALLPQILNAVSIPVIAAGGIANAAGVRAAMALGAAGVQVGTAYLCCPEATTSALHRAALMSDAAQHTALTTLFSGRPARGIVNRLMRQLGPLSPAAPAFPLATAAVAPLRAHFEALGRTDCTPLWSGQNASGCRAVSATALTQELAHGLD